MVLCVTIAYSAVSIGRHPDPSKAETISVTALPEEGAPRKVSDMCLLSKTILSAKRSASILLLVISSVPALASANQNNLVLPEHFSQGMAGNLVSQLVADPIIDGVDSIRVVKGSIEDQNGSQPGTGYSLLIQTHQLVTETRNGAELTPDTLGYNHQIRRVEAFVQYWMPLTVKAIQKSGVRGWSSISSGVDVDPSAGDLGCFKGKAVRQLFGRYDEQNVGLGILMFGGLSSRGRNGSGVCMRDGGLAVAFGPESPGPLLGYELSKVDVYLFPRAIRTPNAAVSVQFYAWNNSPYGVSQNFVTHVSQPMSSAQLLDKKLP